jgi:hypothetical protein
VATGDAGDSSVNATGTLTTLGPVNKVASINANEKMHIDLVGNFGPFTTYGPGLTFPGGSVAQFTYDVYINGAPAIDDAPFRNNLASVNEVGLVSGSGSGVETSYIDNIRVDNELPIPEPSAFFLWALALVGFTFTNLRASTKRRRATEFGEA